MNIDSVREYCLTFPHVTEKVQWDDDLCFKVAGKIFCILPLEPRPLVISFKCTPESFFQLQEIEGIVPAPYLAKNKWVSLERFSVLRDDELRDALATSYLLVWEKLPKRVQNELASPVTGKKAPKKKPAQKPSAGTSSKSRKR